MKTFNAITTRRSILPKGRRVILRDVGAGYFLIVKAQTDRGLMKPTTPFTLFLHAADFERCYAEAKP